MEAQANKFEGWAVVELFGHAKEIGFVTTQYFGTACLFQIDVPELPEREFTLQAPQWIEHEGRTVLAGEGSKVKRAASVGRSRLVGPSAIYSMTPCSQETAMIAIERMQPRPLMILELKKQDAPQVQWPETDRGSRRRRGTGTSLRNPLKNSKPKWPHSPGSEGQAV